MPQRKRRTEAQSSANKKARKARSNIAVAACARCRRSKIRCDANRPTCSACEKAHTDCHYETDIDESRAQAARRQHGELDSLHRSINDSLLWMADQPSNVVQHCLRAASTADDPARVLCTIVDDQRYRSVVEPLHDPRPSEQDFEITPTAKSMCRILTPQPTRGDYMHYTCGLRFPLAYPWLSEAVQLSNSELRSSQPVLRPGIAYSEHLAGLQIGYWTNVDLPDEIAATLIHLYLTVEQPIYGFVHQESFLQGLRSHESAHCSTLLVNSILLWTSATFAPELPSARAYVKPLSTCVSMLLQSEQNHDTPLNVSSLMILALASISMGDDKLAKKYMAAGMDMAETLHLVGEQRHKMEQLSNVSDSKPAILQHAAWGAFNFSTVYALHFQDVSSRTFTRLSPLLPPPCGSVTDSSTYSFAHFSRFWCIVHSMASVYFAAAQPLHKTVPLAFAESIYQRLLRWSEELPDELARSDSMPHNVAEMHICYHAIILDVFRPFLAQRQLLQTVPATIAAPEDAFALSFKHLRALTDYYQSAFEASSVIRTVSWIHGPLYIASTLVTYGIEETRAADFLDNMLRFKALLQSHPVVRTFVKALFGMAVTARVLTFRQAAQHMAEILHGQQNTHARTGPKLETNVILDQRLAVDDRLAAVGDILAAKYDDHALFADFFELTGSDGPG